MVNLTSLLFLVLLSSTYYVANGSSVDSVECEFCKKLFETVYSYLEDETTIKAVEKTLDKVCDRMFKDETKTACENYVDQFTPIIIDLVVKKTSPQEACALIQLCEGPKSFFDLLEDSTDRCDECQGDVESLRNDLRLARNEHIPKLQKCCGQFPTPDGLCDSYISFINPIYDSLDTKLDPKKACKAFGVCSSPLIVKRSATVGKTEPDCDFCKRILKLVDELIEKQAEVDIDIAFDRVCDMLLPSSMRKKCRKYVSTYSKDLVDFILKHTDPDLACHFIGLCKEEPDFQDDLNNLLPFPTVFSKEDCDNCNKSTGWAAVTVQGYATSFNSMLENTCLDYAKDRVLCENYMKTHFDSDTEELISKTSSSYFCINLFGLCPDQN